MSGIRARAGSSSGAPGRGRTTAPCRPRQLLERPLHGARAGAERERERRARPGSPSASKASTAACFSSTGRASTTTSRVLRGASAKPRFGRAHVGQRPSSAAQPPDLDAQPRAVRFVGVLAPGRRARSASRATRRGPCFGERAGEREQHRAASRARHGRACLAHDIAAGVDDERRRRQQRLDLVEQQRAFARRARSGARPACPARSDALSTSAISAGMPACARGVAGPRRARRAPPSS